MSAKLPRLAGRDRLRVTMAYIADAYGVVSLAALAIGAASALVGSLVSLAVDSPAVPLAAAGIGLGLAAGIAGAMFARYRRLGESELALGYEKLAASYFYRVDEDDPTVHYSRSSVTIRALRNGVRLFRHGTSWTGEGAQDIPRVLSAGHSFSSQRKHAGWTNYFVDLGRSLHKGEEDTIDLEQELLDLNRAFETFIAMDVYEPLQVLGLSVRLPDSRLPVFAEGLEYESIDPDGQPISKTPLGIDRSEGVVTWRVANPRLRRRYELRWEYEDGLGLYG